jgi:hypothetical protein
MAPAQSSGFEGLQDDSEPFQLGVRHRELVLGLDQDDARELGPLDLGRQVGLQLADA